MNARMAIAAVALGVLLSSSSSSWGQVYVTDEGDAAAEGYASPTGLYQSGPPMAGPQRPPMAPLNDDLDADAYGPDAYGMQSDGEPPMHMGAGCGDCDSMMSCACEAPFWKHRHGVFGELLFLAPRGLDVAYAVEVDGPVAPPANEGIQVGPVASTDMDYETGFRTGFAFALSDCASIGATYTDFRADTFDDIARTGTNDIRSLVIQPLTSNAADDYIEGSASHDVQFQLVDIDYRWLYSHSQCHALNFTVGARYVDYEQQFDSFFNSTDFRAVDTNVHFEGAGMRLGLDFERHSSQMGFFLYGKSFANFIAGSFNSNYFQGRLQDPLEVNTSWEDERVISMLEMEFGVGWQSKGGRLRASAGYLVTAWFNTVTTENFIDAIQANEFTDVSDTVAFDGLTARLEYRF